MEWKKTMVIITMRKTMVMRLLPRLNASPATNAIVLQCHSTMLEAMAAQHTENFLLLVPNVGLYSQEWRILIFTIRKNTSECKTSMRRKIEKLSALRLQTRNNQNGIEMEKFDKEIRASKFAELMNKHFAASAIPKGIHCLSLRLTNEYPSHVHARRQLPSPEFLLLLSDNSYHHFVLTSDNILLASVVVTYAIQNDVHREKIIFHIITDKKTYAGMHSWFALNPLSPVIVEMKDVYEFDWSAIENVLVLEAVENFYGIRNYYHGNHIVAANLSETTPRRFASKLQARSLKYISILDHLRIYLPKLFPSLDKVVFLNDDVVVQCDLSPLWEIDLGSEDNGVVETCKGEDEWVMSKYFRNYFNFSHPLIANNLNPSECAWAYGMNVFDLPAWKMTYIRDKYHSWLKENLKSNLAMWKLGTLPPALIAFSGHVHPIDPSWHLLGLGYQEKTSSESLKKPAVIHYNGQSKPWLKIGFENLRPFWTKYVNYTDDSEYLKRQFLASRLHIFLSHIILLLDLAFHASRYVAVWSPFVERIEVRLSNWCQDSLSEGANWP